MDLTTKYLGLTLAHPLMPGASPLCDTLDSCKRLEDAGAAALVLRSLFEEQITRDEAVAVERQALGRHEDRRALGLAFEPVIAAAGNLLRRTAERMPAEDQPIRLLGIVVVGDREDVLALLAADVDRVTLARGRRLAAAGARRRAAAGAGVPRTGTAARRRGLL